MSGVKLKTMQELQRKLRELLPNVAGDGLPAQTMNELVAEMCGVCSLAFSLNPGARISAKVGGKAVVVTCGQDGEWAVALEETK